MKKKLVHLEKKLTLRKEELGALDKEKQYALLGGAPMTMDANDNRCYTWWGWCRTMPGLGRTCANPCRW